MPCNAGGSRLCCRPGNHRGVFKRVLRGIEGGEPLVRDVAGFIAIGSYTGVLLTYNTSPVVTSSRERTTRVASTYSKLYVGVNALDSHAVPSVLTTNGGTGRLYRPMILSPINIKTSRFEASATFGLLGGVRFSMVHNGVSRVGALTLKANSTGNISTSVTSYFARRALSGTMTFTGDFSRGANSMVTVAKGASVMTSGSETFMVEGNGSVVSLIANANYRLSSLATTFVTTGRGSVLATTTSTISTVKLTNRATFNELSPLSNGTSCEGCVVSTIYGVAPRKLRRNTGCRVQWGGCTSLHHGQPYLNQRASTLQANEDNVGKQLRLHSTP